MKFFTLVILLLFVTHGFCHTIAEQLNAESLNAEPLNCNYNNMVLKWCRPKREATCYRLKHIYDNVCYQGCVCAPNYVRISDSDPTCIMLDRDGTCPAWVFEEVEYWTEVVKAYRGNVPTLAGIDQLQS